MNLYVELKLIADVGLVGFPNAGKSTFLRSISKAKPAVAAYPFTTLMPTLGHFVFPDNRKISFADLPGLIEGAHMNVGMGHRFLRHVERTKVLLFYVDVNGFRLGPKHPFRSALETIVHLNKELELYQPALLKKPAVLALNKMDQPKARILFDKLKEQISGGLEEAALEHVPQSFHPNEFIQFEDILPLSALKDPHSAYVLAARIRFVFFWKF